MLSLTHILLFDLFEGSTYLTTGTAVRKHVRVEELLEAEHDIDMLHKLLQKDNQLDNSDASALQQSGDDYAQFDLITTRDNIPLVEEDKTKGSRKQVGFVCSLLNIICGKGIRKLSYPILLCGMAVGLIFCFRKN